MTAIARLAAEWLETLDDDALVSEIHDARRVVALRDALTSLECARDRFNELAQHFQTEAQADAVLGPVVEREARVVGALRALKRGAVDTALVLPELAACQSAYERGTARGLPDHDGKWLRAVRS